MMKPYDWKNEGTKRDEETGKTDWIGGLGLLVLALGIGYVAAALGGNPTIPAGLAGTFLYFCIPPFGWIHAAAIWVALFGKN